MEYIAKVNVVLGLILEANDLMPHPLLGGGVTLQDPVVSQ